MALVLETAQKIFKPLKVLMYGPSNSGKTLGALYLASGMVMEKRNCTVEESYKHIVVIDSEFGRGAVYSSLGSYYYIQVTAPYTTKKLTDLIIQLDVMEDIDVIVIDSMTHYWSKAGGILEQKTQKDNLGIGNSYTNWQEFTQVFNSLIDIILASPKIVIATARAKSDTVLISNDKGKMAPKTYGLKPDLREGIDFEFDITINVDKDTHSILLEKSIPGLSTIYDIITTDVGKEFYRVNATNAVVVARNAETIRDSIRTMSRQFPSLIVFVQLQLSGRKLEDLDETELLDLEKKTIAELHKVQVDKSKKQ